jgi:superfamily II DNA helicase RecQ
MPSDSRLETIRELEAKNWTLTFDVELKRQNIRRLEQRLQKEEEDGEQMEYDLDQKEKQLAQSEQERAALEEKLLTLQASLEEEKQRADMAEDRAKEWEKKYIENAKQSIVSNVEGVAQSNTERQVSQHQDKNKKKRKVNNSYQPLIKYDEVITRFINEKLEEDAQETSNMLTTRYLYESFLKRCEDNQPAYIHFSREISKIIPEIFPSVRHVRNSWSNGYMGIKMIAHDE